MELYIKEEIAVCKKWLKELRKKKKTINKGDYEKGVKACKYLIKNTRKNIENKDFEKADKCLNIVGMLLINDGIEEIED